MILRGRPPVSQSGHPGSCLLPQLIILGSAPSAPTLTLASWGPLSQTRIGPQVSPHGDTVSSQIYVGERPSSPLRPILLTHIYTHMCTYMCTYANTHVHMHTHAWLFTHVCRHTHAHTTHTGAHMCGHTHTWAHICTHTQCTGPHACICSHTHAATHAHL